MFTENKLHILSVALILGFTLCLNAVANPDAKASGQSNQALTYKPPKRGAPATRIGGGTRGGNNQLKLEVLAPEHTGWVSKSQPVLYWFLSAPTDLERELILYDGVSVQPLLITRNSGSITAGIHALRLIDHNIQLQADIEYEWSVSLITDPNQPSRNIVASATLTYVKPALDLSTQLANARSTLAARVFASQGYWYDAMESVSEYLKQQPNDPQQKQYRSALLSQVGLTEVVAHEKDL